MLSHVACYLSFVDRGNIAKIYVLEKFMPYCTCHFPRGEAFQFTNHAWGLLIGSQSRRACMRGRISACLIVPLADDSLGTERTELREGI